MNFVYHGVSRRIQCLSIAIITSILLAGCGNKVELTDSEGLAEFFNAVPSGPSLDVNRLVKARIDTGAYRVLPDEAIELTMPAILKVVTAEESVTPEESTPYICRVNEQGMIHLPIVGDIPAAGRTLSQIESAVVNAYYPQYTKSKPSVYAKVVEYKTYKVSITGAVEQAGVYELRWDQMSLVNVLMQAGGISQDGAAVIKIDRVSDRSPLAMPALKQPYKTLPSQYLSASQNRQVTLASYEDNASVSIEDLKMAFRPSQAGQTRGQLLVGYEGKMLINQPVDLSNQTQLFQILDRALVRCPRLPVYELSQRLRSLTDVLYNGSVGAGVQFASAQSRQENVRLASSSQDEAQTGLVRESDALASSNTEIVLPVKGINIPFTDIALHDGDAITVERLAMPLFTVMGLVQKPGNFEYPPEARYNLAQAIGFAGGMDLKLDPRYVTVYRLKQDGTVARAMFKLKHKNDSLTEDLVVPLQPGDIVSVEHTPRTRRKEFLNNFFRLNMGTYLRLEDLYE